MPKVKLPVSQMEVSSAKLCSGQVQVWKRQKATEDLYWAKELAKIDGCPKHQNPSRVDALGKVIVCLCGYHQLW